MQKFNAFVPVDIKVNITARAADVAADKARYVVDYFINNASEYKLALPGIGDVVLTLVPAELPEGESDEPFVEVDATTETLDNLGALPPKPGPGANQTATDILLNLGNPENVDRFRKLREQIEAGV